jgi:hypothetical protein
MSAIHGSVPEFDSDLGPGVRAHNVPLQPGDSMPVVYLLDGRIALGRLSVHPGGTLMSVFGRPQAFADWSKVARAYR